MFDAVCRFFPISLRFAFGLTAAGGAFLAGCAEFLDANGPIPRHAGTVDLGDTVYFQVRRCSGNSE